MRPSAGAAAPIVSIATRTANTSGAPQNARPNNIRMPAAKSITAFSQDSRPPL